ncbi:MULTISPECIES: alpha/beta hydrolase [unclassified Marinomonas]|uniref:alpha/beta hydrolase n=1 Tax=unclassified Marinomonas TaxID=196814 RepID=UPI000AB9697C|nr:MULTISPECIES: alpha/beta hydrolase-fold protein [unclassified Marinomonas]
MMKALLLSLLFSVSLNLKAGSIELTEPELNNSFKLTNSHILAIESQLLGRDYELYIKLPRGYFDENSQSKRYPVLYLNDGPHTFKVASGVTHFPSMDKAILVGISFAKGENGQFSRVRDLTPEVDKSWVNYKTGGAPAYLDFIQKEIFPLIEGQYRTDTNKRMLAGHSLGGSFAAWVLVTKPELFSAYVLTSPSLWFKKDLIFVLENTYASQHTSLNAKVFMATGALETMANGMRNDMVDGHKRFIKRLESRGYHSLQLKGEVVQGTDHYSTFPIGLTKGLMWIYQDI